MSDACNQSLGIIREILADLPSIRQAAASKQIVGYLI